MKMNKAKVIDVQTQMTTKKGALWPLELKEMFEAVFKHKIPYYQTEEEMIQSFREAGARVMIRLASGDKKDFGQIQEAHDYVAQLKRDYLDVVIGFWVPLDPRLSLLKNLRELERCIKDLGSFGYYHNGMLSGIPANDKSLYPLYELCQEEGVPVKISTGHTAAGAGTPGGSGIHLKIEHPIPNIDDVAADFPQLTVIGAHCAWPFHNEMISVMVHKTNVYNDLHGWSPKYFPTELKREVNGRLKGRFLFGSDYPFFEYQRLFRDWEAEGYKPEVLENVYYKNAQRVFGLLKKEAKEWMRN